MTIRVEACWTGRDSGTRFRLTLPSGGHEFVHGDTWNRQTAKDALDVLEHVYRLKRSSIRFAVR